MAITITSPVTRHVVQRQGNNTAVLTIAGVVTGVSTSWITIDSSVSGAAYSGGSPWPLAAGTAFQCVP